MSETNFVRLLQEEITTYEKRTSKSKQISYGLKIGVMFLTLCITIILGLSFNNESYTLLTRNIALVLGAIVTFLSGLMSFWNIEEYFLTNKAIETKLKALLISYRIHQDNNAELNKIKDEFIKIIGKRSVFFEAQSVK